MTRLRIRSPFVETIYRPKDLKEPRFIFSIWRKMVVVDLDGLADFPQRLSYNLFTS